MKKNLIKYLTGMAIGGILVNTIYTFSYTSMILLIFLFIYTFQDLKNK
jgi:uncharacterized membrane protein